MVRVTKLELQRTITDIMNEGDLDQLTTKKIRIICEQKFNVDLSSRKREIDKVVMQFINKQCKAEKGNPDEEGSDSSSYESDSCSSNSSYTDSESQCSTTDGEAENERKPTAAVAIPAQKQKVSSVKQPTSKVPVKKPIASKSSNKVVNSQNKKAAAATTTTSSSKSKGSASKRTISEVDDAAYARQLQAEEWNFRQQTVKKLFRNIPQKKNDKNEQAKKKKATPFKKKCLLSPALAEVLGTNEMSRPDVVQKMWSVIRERNLFDTSNKQYAICDEQLFKIFGKKRIRVIGMMKYLKNHIKDIH